MSLIVIDLNTDIRCSLVFYFTGGKIRQHNRDGLELLKPFITARRNEEKGEQTEKFVCRTLPVSLENSFSSKQDDFLTWLIDEGKGRVIEDWPLTARIFGLNFAAIHTTSMVSRPPNHVNMD